MVLPPLLHKLSSDLLLSAVLNAQNINILAIDKLQINSADKKQIKLTFANLGHISF